jgi:branched-chain amino acid transport system permease protein
LGTLVGAIAGSVLVQIVTAELGRLEWLNPNFVLGIMLMAFVLIVPGGLVPSLRRAIGRFGQRNKARAVRGATDE